MTTSILSIEPQKDTFHELGNWLVSKSNETSTISQINYHLSGRAALLVASLFCLAEAVGRIFFGCIGFVGYFMTIGYFKQAKNFGMKQFQKSSQAGSVGISCFCSIISPKELVNRLQLTKTPTFHFTKPKGPLTPEMRARQVWHGTELIARKLQKQCDRAQTQAKQESDKAFKYLKAPADFEGDAHTERVSNYEVGVCHYIGRRPTMEDEHLATSFDLNVGGEVYPIQLFGVFDGHGGNEASIFVKENLERVLHQTLNGFCENGLSDEAIWNALKITFVRLNEEFKEHRAGTTATVAMILNDKLWTANVGDSRTILDNGVQLSEDAKPTDPYYKKGIERRGGNVIGHRINGILAVARAVGDHFVGAVNERPTITAYPLSAIPKNTHLILTCDGVYDVASTRQVAQAVRSHRNRPVSELAKDIVYSAYQAGSTDNLSALLLKL